MINIGQIPDLLLFSSFYELLDYCKNKHVLMMCFDFWRNMNMFSYERFALYLSSSLWIDGTVTFLTLFEEGEAIPLFEEGGGTNLSYTLKKLNH